MTSPSERVRLIEDAAPQPAPPPRAERPVAILHLGQGAGNSNGARTTVAQLASAQASLGHRVLLHFSGTDTFDDPDYVDERAQVDTVVSPLTGPDAFGFSRAAERWITSPAAAGFDVLHQHGMWKAHARITNLWRATYGGPTVISPHGSLQPAALGFSRWKKRLALAGYDRSNLVAASCLHATAEQELAGFREFGLRNPVAVIAHGASEQWLESRGDAPRFRRRYSIPASSRLLLYVSRIHPSKNLLGLLEAMAQLHESRDEWRLAVVGPVENPAYYARLHRAVAELGLTGRVHWIGELLGQDKRDAFASAELLVLPTRSENFAVVVAEALAAGVPVLTTHEAPWALLETYRCGWWVPLSPVHLRHALDVATSLPPWELRAMGERGRAMVRERFQWIDIAQQMTQLYDWLLGRAARPDFVVMD